MKKSFLLFVMFLIFVISSITFFMILDYLDPYLNKILAIFLISFTFFISISTLSGLILYFIKKIHYRWMVELYHIKTSFRQGLFIAFFCIWVIIFKILNAPIFILGFLLIIILLFLELLLQNLD